MVSTGSVYCQKSKALKPAVRGITPATNPLSSLARHPMAPSVASFVHSRAVITTVPGPAAMMGVPSGVGISTPV